MGRDRKEVDFEDVEKMEKEEAANKIKQFFKGNKKFIDQALTIVYSTHAFQKINKMTLSTDDWNWEKFLMISIYTDWGFKQFSYRKGNDKYAPGNVSPNLEGNKTHDIHEFGVVVYENGSGKTEEYTL